MPSSRSSSMYSVVCARLRLPEPNSSIMIICAIPEVRQVLDDATLTGTLILVRVSVGQIETRPQRRDLVLCDVGLDGTLQTLGALRSRSHMGHAIPPSWIPLVPFRNGACVGRSRQAVCCTNKRSDRMRTPDVAVQLIQSNTRDSVSLCFVASLHCHVRAERRA